MLCASPQGSLPTDSLNCGVIFLTTKPPLCRTCRILMLGKQNLQKVKLHKHSLGPTPIFAFGTFLLRAADMINSNPGIKKTINETCDLNCRDVLNQLCQTAKYYNINIRKSALTFMIGHEVKQFQPLALAEIKMLENCPWTIALFPSDLTNSISGSNLR